MNKKESLARISNKKGFTVPTALAFTLLLMALAASILLVASYRYQKVYVRKAQNQLYLYATSLVEEHTKGVADGQFNELVAKAVEKSKASGNPKLAVYAKSYGFEVGLGSGGTDTISHQFTNDDIDFEMTVTYEPQKSGKVFPSDTKDYIVIGDRMKVEYRISQNNIEYRITADYYCAKNTNVDHAGIPIPSPENYVNMKWELNKYTGQFYNLR